MLDLASPLDGFGSPFGARRGGATPLTIFGSRLMFWYDLSDVSSLYQDSTCTVPVTALNDPIGGVLDKSKGLVLGSDQRSTATVGSAGSPPAVATYNTTTGAGTAARTNFGNQSYVTIPLTTGERYQMSITNTGTDAVTVWTYNAPTAGKDVATTVTAGATVVFRVVAENSGLAVSCAVSPGASAFTINYVCELPGNHAIQATSASRPLWKQDGNSKYHALFDGTDDNWATSAIDFGASDKIAVFAAVRKLTDAAAGILCELSVNANINNGAFSLAAPTSVAANYAFASRGNSAVVGCTVTGPAAPTTNVITGLGDTTAPSSLLRVNGVPGTAVTTAQGSSNYGNYVFYIGRRGGASIPFNGQIYQLFGVLGAVTAAEIAAAEAFANSKSSAY